MKITAVHAHALSVPYEQPRWTAHERMERDQLVLVEVRTDAGLTGYGEIAGGPQPLICDLLRHFAEVVVGMDPLGHAEIWQRLFSLTSPRPGGIGGWDGTAQPAAAGDGGDRRYRHRAVGPEGQSGGNAGVPPAGRHAHRGRHLRDRRLLSPRR